MKKIILLALTLFSINVMSAQTEDGEYVLDKEHANIGFQVLHSGFSFVVGRFNKFDGNVKFESGGESSVNFTIEPSSIDTNNKARDKHLRNEDFFDVETFPIITFQSTKITYNQQGDPEVITGELLLHGVKKEVSFAVEAIGAGESRGKVKAGYKATTVIDRNDFSMGGFNGIGSSVEVTVNLEIQKK